MTTNFSFFGHGRAGPAARFSLHHARTRTPYQSDPHPDPALHSTPLHALTRSVASHLIPLVLVCPPPEGSQADDCGLERALPQDLRRREARPQHLRAAALHFHRDRAVHVPWFVVVAVVAVRCGRETSLFVLWQGVSSAGGRKTLRDKDVILWFMSW